MVKSAALVNSISWSLLYHLYIFFSSILFLYQYLKYSLEMLRRLCWKQVLVLLYGVRIVIRVLSGLKPIQLTL